MPLYAYYFCREDGSAPVFEVVEAESPQQARERAPSLLRAHPSCAYVTVYQDDHELFTVRRQPGAERDGRRPSYSPADIAQILSATRLGLTGAAVIATTPSGLVTYWSPRAARLYGWAVEDALGRDIMELTPALQSRGQAESIMARLQQGAAWEGEIVLRHRLGTPFLAYVCNLALGPVSTGAGAIVGLSVAAEGKYALEGTSRNLALRLALSAEAHEAGSQ